MANGHGGARPGAGRPAKADKYEPEITATERKIADRLPELLEREFDLATGGAERVECLYELALGITVDSHAENPSGVVVKVKKQLFPHAEPDEMVLVSRKVITPEPDRAAIEYLIDRILGKPTASVEMSGPDGGDIPLPVHDLSQLTLAELQAMRGMLKKTTPPQTAQTVTAQTVTAQADAPPSETPAPAAAPRVGGSGAGAA